LKDFNKGYALIQIVKCRIIFKHYRRPLPDWCFHHGKPGMVLLPKDAGLWWTDRDCRSRQYLM